MNISRTPPANIKQVLRQEVNFGCPVRYSTTEGCGCPILTYHHFDPPWVDNYVHNPEGMIALCPTHHNQADGGIWTKAQLCQMKKNPFIDNLLKIPWPWRTEGLVVKIGQSLVLGSGSPMRLRGYKLLGFHPSETTQLGGKVISFDAQVPDKNGDIWLNINDNWFEAHINNVKDILFTPQQRQFQATHYDGSHMKLKFFKVNFSNFQSWYCGIIRSTFENKATGTMEKFVSDCIKSIERKGLVDSDGTVPIMNFEGAFQSPEVKVRVIGNHMYFEPLFNREKELEWEATIVSNEYRAIIVYENGPEIFSLG